MKLLAKFNTKSVFLPKTLRKMAQITFFASFANLSQNHLIGITNLRPEVILGLGYG